MLHSARRAVNRLGGNIRQALEAFPIGIYPDRNELLRGRAADHDGTHRVLHVEFQTLPVLLAER
jgi:hypothetical protein